MEVNEMKFYRTGKLTDLHEELMWLKQQGKLSFVGERELEMCKLMLFGKP